MTINNVACSWSMVQISSKDLTGFNTINPTILSGVKALKWNIKTNTKNNHGLSGQPVSRGFGNTEYTASIKMDYATQSQLRNLYGGLIELGEFDMIVSFANNLANGVTAGVAGVLTTETITLEGCFFNEDGMESEQDDTDIVKEFDLNPFRITITHA